MGIFEQFPYTNFHDLNLDWILRAIQSMDKKLDEFVASNVLSYADPIQWDIETQYAKNTVVVDPKTGTAYMSINPVPVGQLLTNKYYWQPIFNYDEIVNTLKKQIAAVQADQHDTIPVAVGHGGLVWGVNRLYKLTKSLAAGSKIIENENAVPVTVEDAIINIDTTKNITRNTDGTITDTAGTITRKSDNIIDTANNAISVSGKTITNAAADSITNSSTNITDTASAGIARNADTITDTATGDVSVSGKNITDTASAGIARNAATITDTATGDVSVSGKNITDTATGDVSVSGKNITDMASAGIARNAATITDTATDDVSVSGKNITDTASEKAARNAVTITDTATGDVSVSGKNITDTASENRTFNVDGVLDFNAKNPIKYSTPIEKISANFDGMAFKDSENNTKHFLVATDHMEDKKKQIVVIGDSFSSDTQSKTPLWYTYIAKKYNADVITHASDGMGFIVGGDNNFYNQINKCAAEADIDNVMTVYIYGGLNDLTQFTSDSSGIPTVFFQAVMNVIANAQLKFPKSEIVLVGINTFQKYNYYAKDLYGKNNAMYTMRIYMNFAAFKSKIKFIDITNQTLYTPEFYGDANSGEQKHPSAIGEAYIANLILGGSPYKFDTREQPALTGTNCTLREVTCHTKIDSVWVHGIMKPNMTGTCFISFKGYTPPASEYVLFVNQANEQASYGVVDVANENIALYSFNNQEYYFEFQLS